MRRSRSTKARAGCCPTDGKPLALQVQAGEKIHQVYSLEVTNPGGHSSRPVPDNAIYRLTAATQKVSKLSFPDPGDAGRARIFPRHRADAGRRDRRGDERGREGSRRPGGAGDAHERSDLQRACAHHLRRDAARGGHAPNALPQRATATLSCRVMQGTTPEQVKETLEKAIGDPQVKVEHRAPPRWLVRAAADRRDHEAGARARPRRCGPACRSRRSMTAGATDGRFLMNAGIPTYGMSGMFASGRDKRARAQREDPGEVALRRPRFPGRRRPRICEVSALLRIEPCHCRFGDFLPPGSLCGPRVRAMSTAADVFGTVQAQRSAGRARRIPNHA